MDNCVPTEKYSTRIATVSTQDSLISSCEMEYSSQESVSGIKSMEISSQESVCSLQSENTLCTEQDITVNEFSKVKRTQVVGNCSKTIPSVRELGCKRNHQDQSNHEIVQNISNASNFKNVFSPNKCLRLSLHGFYKNRPNDFISCNLNNISNKTILMEKNLSTLKWYKCNYAKEPQNEAKSLSSQRLSCESNRLILNGEKEISEETNFGNNSIAYIPGLSNHAVQKILPVNTYIQPIFRESNVSSQDTPGSNKMDVTSQVSLKSEKMDYVQETSGLMTGDMTGGIEFNKQNETEYIQDRIQVVKKFNPFKIYKKYLRMRKREIEITKREIAVKNREKRVAIRESAVLLRENSLKVRERTILNYEAAIFKTSNLM